MTWRPRSDGEPDPEPDAGPDPEPHTGPEPDSQADPVDDQRTPTDRRSAPDVDTERYSVRTDEPSAERRDDEGPGGAGGDAGRAGDASDRPGSLPAAGIEAATEALEELEPEAAGATVVCVANQKGGVGKTTTTVSLGAALAGEGAQVLVIDLDPQGNATTGLGLRVAEGAPSTYRVLIDDLPVEDAAEPTAVRGLHVVPSSLDLAGAEIELVSVFSRESRLRDALADVRDLYDVVLVDCPPSLGLLTINGLVAADQVIVPIQCEYYALEGLGQLMRTIQLVHDGLNGDLAVGGVVLTMYDARTNLSEQVAEEVRDYFGDLAFKTVVPRTVRLSEAPSYGEPITVFDPSSRGAGAYRRLAREVAGRLGLEVADGPAGDALDLLLGTDTVAEPDELGDPGDVPTSLGTTDDDRESPRAGRPGPATGTPGDPPRTGPGAGRERREQDR